MKEAIVQAPILHYPNPNKTYIIYTDASDDTCRAQLSQEHNGTKFPVAFLSHTFTETQHKWSTTEQEAFGVYYAITKWNYICYSDQVKECKGDTKGLYRMVNTLMGTSSSNPLPSHANNSNLAEDFADFYGKIENIRENLAENQTYRPTGRMTPSLAEFRSFDQTEVKKIIIDMKTKTCELDALLMKLLKDCLEDILPTITDLVSISLRDGVFASRWKTSVIRPLLKKQI